MIKKEMLIITSLLLVCCNCYAYLDPGTGSVVLQVLFATLVAVGAFWGRVVQFIKNFLNNKEN